MKKNIIKLTQSQLCNVVSECVINVLKEYRPEDSLMEGIDRWPYENMQWDLYGFPEVERPTNQMRYRNGLYEGLIRSYDYLLVVDRLKKLGCQILRINTDNVTPVIALQQPNDKTVEIKSLLSQCGWYNSTPNDSIWQLVPRFGADASKVVYDEWKGILYHATPSKNIKRIMEQGLVPRSEGKIDKSQDLVHFCQSEEECIALSHNLYATSANPTESYTLFKTDFSKLPRYELKPKFFFDPKYHYAVITMENIPPYCLIKLKDYEIVL